MATVGLRRLRFGAGVGGESSAQRRTWGWGTLLRRFIFPSRYLSRWVTSAFGFSCLCHGRQWLSPSLLLLSTCLSLIFTDCSARNLRILPGIALCTTVDNDVILELFLHVCVSDFRNTHHLLCIDTEIRTTWFGIVCMCQPVYVAVRMRKCFCNLQVASVKPPTPACCPDAFRGPEVFSCSGGCAASLESKSGCPDLFPLGAARQRKSGATFVYDAKACP